jgi:hypothetical protein
MATDHPNPILPNSNNFSELDNELGKRGFKFTSPWHQHHEQYEYFTREGTDTSDERCYFLLKHQDNSILLVEVFRHVVSNYINIGEINGNQ